MRIIQVPVANRPECVVALTTAFSIAQRSGADVVGVHIRTHRGIKGKASEGKSWLPTWSKSVNWMASTEEEAEEYSRLTATMFKEIATNSNYKVGRKPTKNLSPVAIWRERVGTPDYIMPIIGPAADMMVVSRPAKNGGRKARVFMMQALMNSHRPVLIIPHKPTKTIATQIAIAWNRSGEAARALHASLSLLKIAEKVSFVTVGQPTGSGPGAPEMVRFLRHHGVKADVLSVVNGNDDEEIMKAYNAIGADLLVMGAYSRNRVSELIFGGVTQRMLFSAEIPVLMLHS